jgi:hypothetical protein
LNSCTLAVEQLRRRPRRYARIDQPTRIKTIPTTTMQPPTITGAHPEFCIGRDRHPYPGKQNEAADRDQRNACRSPHEPLHRLVQARPTPRRGPTGGHFSFVELAEPRPRFSQKKRRYFALRLRLRRWDFSRVFPLYYDVAAVIRVRKILTLRLGADERKTSRGCDERARRVARRLCARGCSGGCAS